MQVLLDTHILLWWLADSKKLQQTHRTLIANGENRVLVSSVSIAEIAIKSSLGKIEAPTGITEAVKECGFGALSFNAEHAEKLRNLPWHHRDPFDRMLIAQALVERIPLVTVDRAIHEYGVAWAETPR